ncbi:MAG: tRNA (adenosine(37)-N6)-dimethylallyltransferase MiaA [Clostridia bacterium]|nr:tRNA (adenosine(37)-N6)-dimethylallyltransferase MiaA [Clostridia bacterium]
MRVFAIVGPTAVGKTALAIELAKKYNGEIISCDSMQIYKGMDIGTAKPTREELNSVPHHLIDIKEPDENFSCADYQALAKSIIDGIIKRGKTPIFCGGTGLYLDSVLEIPSFAEVTKDEEYRAHLENLAEQIGAEGIHKMLAQIDPESAEAIHPNNVKRVIRALEIYKASGKTKSELDKESKKLTPPYDSCVFFLCAKDRELLYKRIENRVDIMLNEGLLDEARSLFDRGLLKEEFTSFGAIGYKEFIPYFEGKASLSSCVDELKKATRHYAKRQLTWFSRHGSYHKIYIDECDAFSYACDIIEGKNKVNERFEEIKNNYEKVSSKIKELDKDGRVSLLAATKMQCATDINYLISQGVKIIGENRVNELLEKYDSYDKSAELHFIGTLQKNKVKYIIDKVSLIHSLDSYALAEEIDKRAKKINKTMDVLIEVNSGREENKGGIMPESVSEFLGEVSRLENVRVRGLMTMAPKCQSGEEYLKYFSETKELFDKLFGGVDDAILSMGMSESYEYAIMAGATIVRVGSKIFGERK